MRRYFLLDPMIKNLSLVSLFTLLLLYPKVAVAQDPLYNYLQRLYLRHTGLQVAAVKYHKQLLSDSLRISTFISEPQLFLGYIPWKVGMPPIQLGLGQKLPLPGQRSKLKSQLKSHATQKALSLRARHEAAALVLLNKLYRLYELSRHQKLLQKKEQLLRQQEQMLEKQLQSSTTGTESLDLLDLQSKIEATTEQILVIKEQGALLRLDIGLQLDLSAEKILTPDTLYLPILHKDSLLHDLPLRNIQLLAQQQAEISTTAALSYRRSLDWPQPQIRVSYLSRETRPNFELQAPHTLKGGLLLGMSLRIPIPDKRYRQKSQLDQHELLLQELQTKKEEERLLLELESAWISYVQSIRSIALYQNLLQKSQQSLSLLLNRLALHNKASLNYLKMQTKQIGLQMKQVTALRKGCEAALQLQQLSGQLAY